MRNENLIATRRKSGKTQAQVSKETGLAEVAYQRYEYCMREPKVTTAVKIARTLGVKNFQEFCELWGGNPIQVL